jgi:membrane protein
MMTVIYTMFSLLPEFDAIGQLIQDFVFKNFVPDSSALVRDKLLEFSERARNLTLAGFSFLFVTAFLMLVTLEKAFNTIWRVPEPRRGLQRFLLYWGVLSLGPPLVAGGLIMSVYVASLPLLTDLDTIGVGDTVLEYLPLLSGTAVFTVLYYAVPNCSVPFKHAVVGGLVTTVLFEMAKELFKWIVTNTSIEPIYGTFAAVPLFLAWLYLVWVLVLSGAIFVRTLSLQRDLEGEDREPKLVKCARVLQLLYDAHMRGEPVADYEIHQQVMLNREEHDQIFGVLLDLKVLSQTEDERWMLGRNLKGLTLWDLYQRLPEGLDVKRLELVKDMQRVTEPLKSMAQFGSNEMAVSLDNVFGSLQ